MIWNCTPGCRLVSIHRSLSRLVLIHSLSLSISFSLFISLGPFFSFLYAFVFFSQVCSHKWQWKSIHVFHPTKHRAIWTHDLRLSNKTSCLSLISAGVNSCSAPNDNDIYLCITIVSYIWTDVMEQREDYLECYSKAKCYITDDKYVKSMHATSCSFFVWPFHSWNVSM